MSVEIVHFLLLVFYKYSSNYAKKGSQRLLYDHLSPSLSARKLNSPTFFQTIYSSGAFSYIVVQVRDSKDAPTIATTTRHKQITYLTSHASFSPQKLLKMLHLNFWILALSINFCPIKTNLSGNTV